MKWVKAAVATSLAAASLVVAGCSADAPKTAAAQIQPLGEDFLFGVATAGFQVEGATPDSNWSRYAAGGAVTHPVGEATDFYHRFREDITLARDLGAKVFRLSVEWARLQPAPGEWDEEGFRYYDSVLAAVRAAGMRPMITLDHWVYPGWKADQGGWSDPAFVTDWLANAEKVVDRYAAHNPLWVTFNEAGAGERMRLAGADEATVHAKTVAAHNAVYDYIHRVQPGAMVTSNVAYMNFLEEQINGPFVDAVAGKLDYVGIDYYYGVTPDNLVPAMENLDRVDGLVHIPLQSEGIYYAIRHYAKKFPDLPIFIVENGMPTDNATPRPDGYTRTDLLNDTIYWIQRAEADGMKVMGYNYWSLTDNYEWGSYNPRFGLYTVDVTSGDLTREPTDAVPAYRTIIANRGVPQHYRPTREPVPCSLVDNAASCQHPVTLPPE